MICGTNAQDILVRAKVQLARHVEVDQYAILADTRPARAESVSSTTNGESRFQEGYYLQGNPDLVGVLWRKDTCWLQPTNFRPVERQSAN